MRLLHTSDWHLGRTLYGRKRYEEQAAFLDWLIDTIREKHVDTLIVAGDIFDTSTPSNRAQELYYGFLSRLPATACRHTIIIAGNHDSPTFLDAPGNLLKAMHIHVMGAASSDPTDECLFLADRNGQPEALVCAVPYLRDRDVRRASAGETIADKNRKLIEGIRKHYAAVCDLAAKQRESVGDDIPIIATGHLFVTGGRTTDGDGVRELYVGTLAHVDREIFPSVIDYLALGHLHVPQNLSGSDHQRYSGSPIPMGYGEVKQQKQVLLVDFQGRQPTVTPVAVPCFQELERISGSLEMILSRLQYLREQDSSAWLEIEYTGQEIIGNLREQIIDLAAGSRLEIRRIKNRRVAERVLSRNFADEMLDDLEVSDVFERCLDSHQVTEIERNELRRLFQEIVQNHEEADPHAG